MKITRVSVFTGKVHTMDLDVTEAELTAYAEGTLLQVAFPRLTAGEREFVKTGVTPEEWKEVFGE